MLDPQDQEPEIADPRQEADTESSEAEELDTLDIQDGGRVRLLHLGRLDVILLAGISHFGL